LTVDVDPYVWRSCGGAIGKAIAWPASNWSAVRKNTTLAAGVRAAVEETQRLREIVSDVNALYWPLTLTLVTEPFAASQHALEDSRGFALIFRRPIGRDRSSTFARIDPNRSAFTMQLTTPKPNQGYFQGKYDTSLAANVSELEPCKAMCVASANCEGVTFVENGGPPCVLYSRIFGAFAKSDRVTQFAKLYTGSQLFALDGRGFKHAVMVAANAPFLESCRRSFVPSCCTTPTADCTPCALLTKAQTGAAGCPPYPAAPGQQVSNNSVDFEPRLRGLDTSTTYMVAMYEDSYKVTRTQTMSGAELAALRLAMRPRSSILLEFTKEGL
jgi:hypothetical protein